MFLPGLTADHRLFEKQTEYFEKKQNVFVWDAPSHALSRPFTNNYSLSDMAEWLYEILAKEEIYNPIIIGQSMGGYLAQMYMELYPDKIKGFISIDSAPLQKSYMTAMEIWLLERAEPLYKIYPWKALLRAGSRGGAETDYGQNLMRKMMMSYNPDHKEYARLVADREKAKDILKRVNYYRFTGYALQFRQEPSGSDYIEKAEVYYRTQIVYGFSIAKCIEAPHD